MIISGNEFTEHKQIDEALNIDFYFAKLYYSWERGSKWFSKVIFLEKHNFDTINKE